MLLSINLKLLYLVMFIMSVILGGGGGSNPIFAHGKNVSFRIFAHGKKWGKKYMEREGNEYFSFSFHILFFPFFPMGKNGEKWEDTFFPWAKMGLDTPPPPYIMFIMSVS